MEQEKQLKQLSIEYSTLKEQDKTYILGVAKALAFAADNGWNSAGKSKTGRKSNKAPAS